MPEHEDIEIRTEQLGAAIAADPEAFAAFLQGIAAAYEETSTSPSLQNSLLHVASNATHIAEYAE